MSNNEAFRAKMKARFERLATSYTPQIPQAMIDGWFQIVESMYDASIRKYHDMTHISRLYDLWESDTLFKRMMMPPDEIRLVELGIWFHDVVYVPADPDNESVSADLACSFLTAMGSFQRDQKVIREAIMATKYNRDEKPSRSQALEQWSARRGEEGLVESTIAILSDLDLAGLALPEDEFLSDVANIRQEFSRFTDEQYCWGRVKFMAALLKHPIYLRAKHLEAKARENLEKHLVDLIQGLSQHP